MRRVRELLPVMVERHECDLGGRLQPLIMGLFDSASRVTGDITAKILALSYYGGVATLVEQTATWRCVCGYLQIRMPLEVVYNSMMTLQRGDHGGASWCVCFGKNVVPNIFGPFNSSQADV